MKTLLLLFTLALPAFGQLNPADTPFAATPTPAPPQVIVVQAPPAASTPEAFTAKALAWITAGFTVLGALAAGLFTLWSKVHDLRERADRQAAKTGSLQQQVTTVALAAPPPAPAKLPPKLPGVAVVLVFLALFLSGCAGLPERTYSLYGEDKDGNKLGASVKLGDTRGLAK